MHKIQYKDSRALYLVPLYAKINFKINEQQQLEIPPIPFGNNIKHCNWST